MSAKVYEKLIQTNALVFSNEKDEKGNTPIMRAVKDRNRKLIQLLLKIDKIPDDAWKFRVFEFASETEIRNFYKNHPPRVKYIKDVASFLYGLEYGGRDDNVIGRGWMYANPRALERNEILGRWVPVPEDVPAELCEHSYQDAKKRESVANLILSIYTTRINTLEEKLKLENQYIYDALYRKAGTDVINYINEYMNLKQCPACKQNKNICVRYTPDLLIRGNQNIKSVLCMNCFLSKIRKGEFNASFFDGVETIACKESKTLKILRGPLPESKDNRGNGNSNRRKRSRKRKF